MASLDKLPVELLHVIAELVLKVARVTTGGRSKTLRPGRGDLSALARTNRRLHQVVNPILYQRDRQEKAIALAWAVENSSFPTLEKVLSFGYDLNSRVCYAPPTEPVYPIRLTIWNEHVLVLKWLLEHGAKPDWGIVEDLELEGSKTIHRMIDATTSPLHESLEDYPNDEAALMLLDHGAHIFFGKSGRFGSAPEGHPLEYTETALHLAASEGLPNAVERLLLEEAVSVDLKDCRGFTALHQAVSMSDSTTPVIEVLLRHGADPHTLVGTGRTLGTEAIFIAIDTGHVENILALIQAMADASSTNAPTQIWSHRFLYRILERFPNRFGSNVTAEGLDDEDELRMVIAKLIECGADFNNPPAPNHEPEGVFEPLLSLAATSVVDTSDEPVVFKTLIEAGVDPFLRLKDGRTLFHSKSLEWVCYGCVPPRDLVEILLSVGTSMGHRDIGTPDAKRRGPPTDKTVLELMVDLCDDARCGDTKGLEFLITHATPSTLPASHVYEVLDSRLDDLQNHLLGCLLIMHHGWISKKARTYMFEWLVSYITGIPVRQSGLYLDKTNGAFNSMAAKLFPGLLTREQLDQLWEKGLASYTVGLDGPYGRVKCSERKWTKIPWLHINAERDDVEAIQMLLDRNFRSPRRSDFEGDDDREYAATKGYHSPLMRAIYRGHEKTAMFLIQHASKTRFLLEAYLDCGDHMLDENSMGSCLICPYGQRSAYDLAVSFGEVELIDQMFSTDAYYWQVAHHYWKDLQRCMPRVYSHGNILAEWMDLKLAMQDWTTLETNEQNASWLRLDMARILAKLRSEVEEIRDAWRATAKSLERKDKWESLPRAWEVQEGTQCR